MLFFVGTCSEEEMISICTQNSIAKFQSPETIDDDSFAIFVFQRTEEFSRLWIKGVDPAITEIPDQQSAAERTEVGWRQCQTPGCIEFAMRDETIGEFSARCEDIDEAITWTFDIIML